ncbi:MAG: N-acetyl-gamma-glutamyl-phosphate reductase, partial [Bacteroidota bacterium]
MKDSHISINVGIIGGAGYTAGELIRLLLRHPAVNIAFITSNSQAGKPITAIHSDLIGETDLVFQRDPLEVDVLFLCMGHGKSAIWLADNPPRTDTLVVDLSRDFRLDEDWVYGLPELNREKIIGHKRIANPGCFATAIQLAALPLAASGKVDASFNVHAITGSTGAGQNPTTTTHFSWRNNNVSIYKAFRHQHLTEIDRSSRVLPSSRTSRNRMNVKR